MSHKTKLVGYGENAATFLIFQGLALKPGALKNVFIARLRQFGTGNSTSWEGLDEGEVWLYPNFGKGSGFGEPDVLVLSGPYAFWIEVETTVNCQTRLPALRNSLLQLWRFKLFQDAISRPAATEQASRRIIGTTLDNNRIARPAKLRLKGHHALQRIRSRLKNTNGNDHYVLFTVDRPKGEGVNRRSYEQVLSDETVKMGEGYPEALPRLDIKRCWYAYWRDDLESFYNETEPSLDLDQHYVSIKRNWW